jgi:hypothetical protein
MKLKIQLQHPNAKAPTYATEGAAAFDLYAATVNGAASIGDVVYPGHPVICDTGVAFEAPEGYMLQVRSRSGLAFKHGVEHTPGPWILHPTAHHPAVRSIGTPDTGPRRICTVGTMNGNPVDKANARLIAAAPELLEAAIELKDVCNRPSAARTRAEAWRKLDKAIAKALQPEITGSPSGLSG